MKEKKANRFISKSLLIASAALLLTLLILLTWIALMPAPLPFVEGEEEAVVDLQLPEALPLDDVILKDEKEEEDKGGAASNEHDEKKKHTELAEKKIFETNTSAKIDVPKDKIAVGFVFSELGLHEELLKNIIDTTPAAITLAFLPQSADLKTKTSNARQKGHEVLLNLAMEPTDYPNTDTGPQTLLTGLSTEENLKRLQMAQEQAEHHMGFMNFQGSLFLASTEDLKPILQHLQSQGAAFMESETNYRSKAAEICEELHIPYWKSNIVLSESLTPGELQATLIRAEQSGKEKGTITIVAHASPMTTPILLEWIKKAQEQEYVFVPLSQLILAEQDKQKAVS